MEKYIKYKVTQDFESLLKQADAQFACEEKKKRKVFLTNKEKLLPYVLQLLESAITIHNMRCKIDSSSVSSRSGLFWLRKVNLEDELQDAMSDRCWSFKGDSFEKLLGLTTVKIWLNKPSKFIATPHLPYSMTILKKGGDNINDVYAKSIETEIENLIRIVAEKYHDEW